jgi:myo-inositol-1(or 4)-monophosphatase
MKQVFLDRAERMIVDTLKEVRPSLLQSHGSIEHSLKDDSTVVTMLDKSTENVIRETLRKIDPAIGIEGEEFGIEGSRDCYWLVDPIDGTEQFIRGLNGCKNLLALVENGETQWALMYMFVTDQLWIARKGKGLTMNGQIIRRPYRPLSRNWMEINVNLLDPTHVEVLSRVRPNVASFTVSRDTSVVVGGKVDGIIGLDVGGGPWDYAARGLLFAESGAKIANVGLDSYDFRINNFVMCHPDNFDNLMNLVTGKDAAC